MTYDVAVWEGRRPSDDGEAGEMLDRLMDAEEARQDSGATPEPPTPGISAFLSDLLER